MFVKWEIRSNFYFHLMIVLKIQRTGSKIFTFFWLVVSSFNSWLITVFFFFIRKSQDELLRNQITSIFRKKDIFFLLHEEKIILILANKEISKEYKNTTHKKMRPNTWLDFVFLSSFFKYIYKKMYIKHVPPVYYCIQTYLNNRKKGVY